MQHMRQTDVSLQLERPYGRSNKNTYSIYVLDTTEKKKHIVKHSKRVVTLLISSEFFSRFSIKIRLKTAEQPNFTMIWPENLVKTWQH
jgi:hypothetical protein